LPCTAAPSPTEHDVAATTLVPVLRFNQGDPMTIRNPRAVLAIAAVLVVLCGCATQPTLGATSWPGCSAFSSQSEAQSAWEADGRPARADGDSDGRVCESLPSTSPSAGGSPSAQTPSSPGAALPTSPAAPAPGSVTTRVSPLQDPRGIHPSLTPVPAGQRARARARIKRVRTAAAGSSTGYSRSQFGVAWTDSTTDTWGHDGCKTREEILHRDLRAVTFRAGTHDCVVLIGVLKEPYTASTISFTKAQPLTVQIDHVMPLAYDWAQGAAGWTKAKREQIANDPLNLLAVDGPSNGQKSASGPAEWMPPNPRVGCAYAVRFAMVSLKYKLPVQPQDKRKMLTSCGAS